MKKQKVIIIKSMNLTPEHELEKRLEELGPGWNVVSASTSLTTHGTMDYHNKREGVILDGIARHIYFVTTVIVEKVE
ncbi:hypothetical protein D6779_03345 [Candidatus Parcubacteria bacterium]|nr:MAG: hypothetical protein D6779_03345 [Candidatus Parcubacteria bacterium]